MRKSPFDIVQSATQKAFGMVGKTIGQESNPDLRIYNSLRPGDFTKLMQKYGEQDVLDYIKHMELVRIKGGQ